MISQHPVLSSSECGDVLDTLETMRSSWIDRAPDQPGRFYTVGRAAYLDVCLAGADPEKQYYGEIGAANRRLQAALPWLYDRVVESLYEVLSGPLELATTLAVPGFHLFYGRAINSAGNSRAHFDVQYSQLRLPAPPDDDDPVSFTLAVCLPKHGSGLDTWNITVPDYERACARGVVRTAEEYAARKVCAYRAYREGWMIVHKGLILHRLQSPGPISDDDVRVTLQGHALRIAGRWLLYW